MPLDQLLEQDQVLESDSRSASRSVLALPCAGLVLILRLIELSQEPVHYSICGCTRSRPSRALASKARIGRRVMSVGTLLGATLTIIGYQYAVLRRPLLEMSGTSLSTKEARCYCGSLLCLPAWRRE